ncbi:DUF6691 family protein [Dyella sp. ASV21]|jgi:uncharacterized membrane protein YedE/YeeE|uniref:DUF6691 family protein n=1 Tax=Dyella sp. ASV21 TaxID=2795114 RepID=UPI0018EE2FDA|nr:DUF6691 family protein [Dyella sp. ASV21]
MKAWIAMLAGVLFGLGLSLAGMTQPAVVLGFLDLFGRWDPRLMFVMLGAVVTTAVGYRCVWRGRRPWLADGFQLPAAQAIDARLVAGAAMFGIGWGIAGYCPGPALASLTAGNPAVLLLVACMGLGWWLAATFTATTVSPA